MGPAGIQQTPPLVFNRPSTITMDAAEPVEGGGTPRLEVEIPREATEEPEAREVELVEWGGMRLR